MVAQLKIPAAIFLHMFQNEFVLRRELPLLKIGPLRIESTSAFSVCTFACVLADICTKSVVINEHQKDEL